jgi:enamine deaminase RidA (YjgF/YER057c/UK114 family)
MSIEKKLADLGLAVPTPAKPLAAYVPAVRTGNLIFTSGQLPTVAGDLKSKGLVGVDVTKEEAKAAAKLCILNALAAVKGVTGDLDAIVRIVKLTGFVASAEGFNEQPFVINGASELLQQVFGEQGQHARSAVGVAELPLGASVEIEMIVEVK